MNINRKRQSQFELFPGVSKNSSLDSVKTAHLTKDLTLSLENIIVLCIVFVMVVVLFFSFGVEKGKKIAMLGDSNTQTNALRAEVKLTQSKPDLTESAKPNDSQVVVPVEVKEKSIQGQQPAVRPVLENLDDQKELFTIQVASFKRKENAQREAQRLKNGGHEDIFVIAKGSHSIVCVGKFAKKVEAKLFSNKLKTRYNDCLVRSL